MRDENCLVCCTRERRISRKHLISNDAYRVYIGSRVDIALTQRLFRGHDLMDRMPGEEITGAVRMAAENVPSVRAIEKLTARKMGLVYYIDIHVQADPDMSLHDSHELSGAVKSAIRRSVPSVAGVLVHMEPFEAQLPVL